MTRRDYYLGLNMMFTKCIDKHYFQKVSVPPADITVWIIPDDLPARRTWCVVAFCGLRPVDGRENVHGDGVAIGAMTSAGNELRHVCLTALAKT